MSQRHAFLQEKNQSELERSLQLVSLANDAFAKFKDDPFYNFLCKKRTNWNYNALLEQGPRKEHMNKVCHAIAEHEIHNYLD